ncbi:hypothetical protein CMI37_23795 [Candidatus Pacearchaeota archaeon]|nr:hypothetical protein [Candidatus Pacearchaeota archaeon]|tara:strand:- start:3625 stop:4329 length:705 start_codon:yes stop_codon:yes gene_type:complete
MTLINPANLAMKYIKESHQMSTAQKKEFSLNEEIQVYLKDKITNDIDLGAVLHRLKSTFPLHLFSEVDAIFIGMFEEFDVRDVNALYKDGAIYVSSEQDNIQDMIDDIIHEIAHSLEIPYGGLIYGDGKMEKEFLSKRLKLYEIIKSEGLKPNKKAFLSPEYSQGMDDYLYKEVGYDRLNFIISSYGLFPSAYATTSLKEYFANGFEHFFLDDRSDLEECCPELYKKIEELYEL